METAGDLWACRPGSAYGDVLVELNFDGDGLVGVQASLFLYWNDWAVALLCSDAVDISFPGDEKLRICLGLLEL